MVINFEKKKYTESKSVDNLQPFEAVDERIVQLDQRERWKLPSRRRDLLTEHLSLELPSAVNHPGLVNSIQGHLRDVNTHKFERIPTRSFESEEGSLAVSVYPGNKQTIIVRE